MINRCRVIRGQWHPSEKTATFPDEQSTREAAGKIPYTRRKQYYLPWYNSKLGAWTLVPCPRRAKESCDTQAPISPRQLKRINLGAYKVWERAQARKAEWAPGFGVVREGEDLSDVGVRAIVEDLYRPVIYQPSQFGDDAGGAVPDYYKKETEVARKYVELERMNQRWDPKTKEPLATDSEAWIYLHGTVYKHPFPDPDFHQIYMYLSRNVLGRELGAFTPEEQKKRNIPVYEGAMSGREAERTAGKTEGWMPTKLTPTQRGKLTEFKRFLYQQSKQAMEGKP